MTFALCAEYFTFSYFVLLEEVTQEWAANDERVWNSLQELYYPNTVTCDMLPENDCRAVSEHCREKFRVHIFQSYGTYLTYADIQYQRLQQHFAS